MSASPRSTTISVTLASSYEGMITIRTRIVLSRTTIFCSTSSAFTLSGDDSVCLPIGLILSLPILAIMLWIPEALIHFAFEKKYYMVVVSIGTLIIEIIAQLIGKSKPRP